MHTASLYRSSTSGLVGNHCHGHTTDIRPDSGPTNVENGYIYFVIQGKKDEFTKHYRTQRRKQVRLAIKPQGTWVGQRLSVCCLMYSNIECSISIRREATSVILSGSSLELSGELTFCRRKGTLVALMLQILTHYDNMFPYHLSLCFSFTASLWLRTQCCTRPRHSSPIRHRLEEGRREMRDSCLDQSYMSSGPWLQLKSLLYSGPLV